MKKIISIIMIALIGISIIPKTIINERHIVLESTTNVYTKEEVDNLLSTIRTNITNNTNEITNIKSELTTLQNRLKDYALKTSLNTTNSNIDGLNTVASSNASKITALETLYSGGNATASQILKGKTAIVGSKQVTGTMENKSGTTTATSTVTESGDNVLIKIPENGYYSTDSKISVPIETITNNISRKVQVIANISNTVYAGIASSSKSYVATSDQEHIVVLAFGGGTNTRSTSLTLNEKVVEGTSTYTSTGTNSATITTIWDLNITKGDVVSITATGQNSSQFCTSGIIIIKQ